MSWPCPSAWARPPSSRSWPPVAGRPADRRRRPHRRGAEHRGRPVGAPRPAAGVHPPRRALPEDGSRPGVVLPRARPCGPSMLLAGGGAGRHDPAHHRGAVRTSMPAVAVADREAARALGATRWQVVRDGGGARGPYRDRGRGDPGHRPGHGRDHRRGHGDRQQLRRSPTPLLSPGATLGSAIINNFGEASPGLDRASVIGLVVVLLALSALVNVGGQLLLRSRALGGGRGVSGASSRRSTPTPAWGGHRGPSRLVARLGPPFPGSGAGSTGRGGHGAVRRGRGPYLAGPARGPRRPTPPAGASTPCRWAS